MSAPEGSPVDLIESSVGRLDLYLKDEGPVGSDLKLCGYDAARDSTATSRTPNKWFMAIEIEIYVQIKLT